MKFLQQRFGKEVRLVSISKGRKRGDLQISFQEFNEAAEPEVGLWQDAMKARQSTNVTLQIK